MDNDPKLQKFINLLETANQDAVTPDELVQTVEVIAGVIKEVKDDCKEEYDSLEVSLTQQIDTVDKRVDSVERNILATEQNLKRDIRTISLTPGKDGRDGLDGKDGVGKDGRDGRDGKDGHDALDETPDQIIEKINTSNLLIKKERIEGLVDIIQNVVASAVPITTNFFNGLRAKNLTINGATAVQRGDTVFVTVTAGTGTVQSVVAGTNVTVDNTDPANPIVSATGGGSFPVMVPTGSLNQGVFTFTSAPSIIVLDNGNTMNKVSKDGSVNWTGTTTVTLTQFPSFNIFGY